MKKGYAFTLDAAFAILIIIAGLAIIYYSGAQTHKTDFRAEQLSEDIIGVLFHTKVSDLCKDVRTSFCTCPNYEKLTEIVCSHYIFNLDTDILSVISEAIQTGSVSGEALEALIYELFVTNNLINENRYGFSVMYTDPQSSTPFEIYNTETYT
jgi:hypothetical protein